MNEYEAIFARKSVRKYNGELKLSEEELELIRDKLNGLTPLVDGIEVEFEIKPCKETNCKFNAQYCVVAYSQEKEHINWHSWICFCPRLTSARVGTVWEELKKSTLTANGTLLCIVSANAESRISAAAKKSLRERKQRKFGKANFWAELRTR